MEENNIKINENRKVELQDEIEQLQVTISYFESGEADRENAELYDRYEITEEEYLEYKENIGKQLSQAKEKMQELVDELNILQELEVIDLQIKEKGDEIENLQLSISYFASGEADRENEEQYDRGEITEEEYLENKENIDKEYNDAKAKMDIAVNELNHLKERREKLIGKREVKKDIEQKDEVIVENEENTLEEKDVEKDIEQKDKITVENKENTLEENDVEKAEENKTEKENKNTDSNKKTDKSDDKVTVNNENKNNSMSAANKSVEEEEKYNQENKQLEVYKKPNRFLAFFKKIINKIKNLTNKDRQGDFEEMVAQDLQRDGIGISKDELENSSFMKDLQQVYSNEETVLNTYEREADVDITINEKDITREDENVI